MSNSIHYKCIQTTLLKQLDEKSYFSIQLALDENDLNKTQVFLGGSQNVGAYDHVVNLQVLQSRHS